MIEFYHVGKGVFETPLGSWDSHFSRHQPIIPSSEPSPFKGIFPKNRWSWKLFTLHSSLIPALEGRNLFLILQESQTPLFQCGRILSSLLDIPRPVPLYYISCLLGSVCGVDFLPGYLYFPSTMVTTRTYEFCCQIPMMLTTYDWGHVPNHM